MSESLRNDGRIWVPKQQDDSRKANDIPEEERDYYLERRYPSFGNLAPRDIASRAAKERIDAGYGVGRLKNAVYLDFKHAIEHFGLETIKIGTVTSSICTRRLRESMPTKNQCKFRQPLISLWVVCGLTMNL